MKVLIPFKQAPALREAFLLNTAMLSFFSVTVNLMFLVFLYFYFGSFIALMLNWRNPFIVLILLELQLLIIFYFFAYFSFVCYLIIGFVIALFVLSFAGAEASAGIAFLINFYRSRGVLTAKFPPALRSTLPFLVLSSDSFFFNYAYSSSLDAFYVKKSSDTFSLLDIDTFGCYSFLPSNFYICDGLMSDEVSLFTTLSLYLCLPVVEPMVSGFY